MDSALLWSLQAHNLHPTLLGTVTLGAPTATIGFQVAQNYQALQLVGLVRGTAAATSSNILIQFNGDTGNNYWYQSVLGTINADSAIRFPVASATAGAGDATTFN